MAELADAIDLGSIANRRAGSSPVIRRIKVKSIRQNSRPKGRLFCISESFSPLISMTVFQGCGAQVLFKEPV